MAEGSDIYLLGKKNGSKYWRMVYRYWGKRKTLALGVYPEISLKDARESLREANPTVPTITTPGEVRRKVRLGQKRG